MHQREHCTCGFLANSSNNPDMPIVWDEQVGMYLFEYGPTGSESCIAIYYCPSCGSKAPEQEENPDPVNVPQWEKDRLVALFDGLDSISQVIDRFGRPTHDLGRASSVTRLQEERKPEVTEYMRCIWYDNLSDLALVMVQEHKHHGIMVAVIQRQDGNKRVAPRANE